MDVWERQRALGRTTVAWAAVSIGAGAALAVRRDPWWRGFGQQQLGWGVVDLAIVGVVAARQRRRRSRLPAPDGPDTRRREARRLRTILLVNAAADAGYCIVGARLLRRPDPRVAGAGAGILVQGAFLLLHDSHHAFWLRP